MRNAYTDRTGRTITNTGGGGMPNSTAWKPRAGTLVKVYLRILRGERDHVQD